MIHESSDDRMKRWSEDAQFAEWLGTLNQAIAEVPNDAQWNYEAQAAHVAEMRK